MGARLSGQMLATAEPDFEADLFGRVGEEN
jgi:hypothetical protein